VVGESQVCSFHQSVCFKVYFVFRDICRVGWGCVEDTLQRTTRDLESIYVYVQGRKPEI